MGFMDRIQSAADDFNSRQMAGSSEQVRAAFPDGRPIPRTDRIHLSKRFPAATVEAYIATLGLPPEDVYAVVPVQSNDVNVAFSVIYRDRPEYESGRAEWAAAEAGTPTA